MLWILLVVLGAALLAAGFASCILPPLPGPPVAYLALFCADAAEDWNAFGWPFLAGMGAVVALVTVLDFVVPVLGARRYGASRMGVWGSIAGLIVGSVFFPPFGMFVGTGAGALAGEVLSGKRGLAAVRAAWGVFLGTVAGLVLKLATVAAIAAYFVLALVG